MRLRILLSVLVVAAPLGLPAGAASAQYFEGQSILFGRPHGSVYEGRWCARENVGGQRIEENCIFDSFESCRRLVIQGNRGFCTQNPAYGAYRDPPVRKKKRRTY
ncbi:MAG: hypothetical protein WCG92_07805 [Hyphomicrobiales bacterium]|nr:hypothetical protein [Alphaproteobacteria bacterium]